LEKKTQTKTHSTQFQLFIFYKPACLRKKKIHGRVLSIRVFSSDGLYISNSLHLARKYARIFVRESEARGNCELRGTDNVQGQISEHIFKVKWRLWCLLSFKYFPQHAQFRKLGNFLGYSPVLAEGIFGHVTRLNQSQTSGNI